MKRSIVDIEPVRQQFQEALSQGLIAPEELSEKSGLYYLSDDAGGLARVTYALIKDGIVLCIVAFIQVESYDDHVCLNLGYAVEPESRRKGLATRVVNDAIDDLIKRLSKESITEFYVEAVVGIENTPSNRLASKLFTANPKQICDGESGEPAFQYLKKFP